MIGDATLFQRADNIEAGWRAVQPILDFWANNPATGFSELCRGQRRSGGGRRIAGARRPRLAAARLSERHRGRDGREAKDLPGAGGRGRHARHRREGADQARAGRRAAACTAPASASPSPAAGRRWAWPCCSMRFRLDTPIAGFNGGLFRQARPHDPRRRRRCRPMSRARRSS